MRSTIIRAITMRLGLVAALLATPGVPAIAASTPGDPTLPAEREDFTYFGGLEYNASVPAPADVIGHEIGERFTRHAQVLDYCQRLADASDRARYVEYGKTHQHRTLAHLIISSPENLRDLDAILERNRELQQPRETSRARADEIIDANPAIVWFSYNVHGNEPSPTETALQVAYVMTAGENEEIRDILDKVVLVIDPCLNPDGRQRYVSWFENAVGAEINADPYAHEHDEPWPGGRSNHYMFDLNRDWLWCVHPESRQRMNIFTRFRPHLHIDFHEQGYRSPYFFGAGDAPYNRNIPQETIRWLHLYGDANAEVFDREGLLYSTKERFDYLYPGYGKVLPVYHGAVGLLTEQAGHSRGGLAIEVDDQYTLTLRKRVRNHFLTSMSYLETTAAKREEQLRRYHDYFRTALTPPDEAPDAFVISPDNDPVLLGKIFDLCRIHGIEIETLDANASIKDLHDYRDGAPQDVDVPAGAWVIRTAQPMGRLAAAVFERETFVEDPDTYDMTSWSIPVMFGLDAWYATDPITAATSPLDSWSEPAGRVIGEGDVAVIVDARQHRFPVAAGLVGERHLSARMAGEDFSIGGRDFSRGSLIVHVARNEQTRLRAFTNDLVDRGLTVHRVGSGMTDQGPVLGANANRDFDPPKIVIVRGSPMSSLSYGHHWHLIDVESPLPHTAVNADALSWLDWSRYNTLLLPSGGGIDGALGDRGMDELRRWIRDGAAVVAVGRSADWASRTLLDLESPERPADPRPNLSELPYEERERRSVEDRVPGAIIRADVDSSHPLTPGVRDWIGVLKYSSRGLPVSDSGQVVVRFDEDARIGGEISDRNLEGLAGQPQMTVHPMGRGVVICIGDDPTVRGFPHASMRLLLNALVYGASL